MAWSIPTYAGQYALGSPSKLRTGLFELCRAVNEREAALGWIDDGAGAGGGMGNLTRFYKADGTLGVNLSMSDLLNIPCTGIGSANLANQNMKFINGFIAAHCPLFTVGATTTPYTLASLESAIGATIDNPLRYNEARWWQSVQDALDLLTYPWGYMSHDSGLDSAPLTDYSDSETSIGAAWAGRHDNTVSAYTGTIPGGYVTHPSFGHWAATTQASRTYGFLSDHVAYVDFSPFTYAPVGTIHATRARYTTSVAHLDAPADFDVDGNTVSVSSALGLTEISVTAFSFASDNYFTVTFDDPASSPFEPDGDPFTDTATRRVYLDAANPAKVYWDITSYLTDQA